jgi:uncharacterized protein (DUF1778 family)
MAKEPTKGSELPCQTDADVTALDCRTVKIPADDWEKFVSWLQRPGKDVPALRKLASTGTEGQD